MLTSVLVFGFLMLAGEGASGPGHGSLLLAGGGHLGVPIAERFIDLAGGRDAKFVFIPTAQEGDMPPGVEATFLRKAGCKNIVMLHTRDRKEADSEDFLRPLRQASAVWFTGGREWRLVDAYLGTRILSELDALLARGGVIGGSSAGASIIGSYLARGGRESNEILMAPGYEEGFGLLRNVVIDQHLLARHRENDLLQVVAKHPELLGIGLDEDTAIVVQGDQFEVLGSSKVAIYISNREHSAANYLLSPGEKFDLQARERVSTRRKHATKADWKR